MSISLPFKGVRIQFPFGLISENNKYQVCIGRQGRVIKSLRTIALIIGARLGRRIKLELIEQL